MRFLITIFLFLYQATAFSQTTVIYGTAKKYKGETIIFYEFIDKIIDTRNEIFLIIPDDNGDFNVEIELTNTKFLVTEYGALTYYFYAEPGKTYKISLPDPQLKSPAQEANPFFIPSLVHLEVASVNNITNEDCLELNNGILQFDNIFESFYNKQILRYYSTIQNRSKLDSFNIALKSFKPVCNSAFYNDYVNYKNGILEFTVNQFNLDYLINKYFTDKPVLLSNPSWWILFDKVYDKYFSFLANQQEFNNIYRIITSSDYFALENLLIKEKSLRNDTLRELILIREINSEFFQGSFSQNVLTALLDSVAEASEIQLSRNLAMEVKSRNTRLLPGSAAPSFLVTDQNGNVHKLEDFKGKYIYLGFCIPNSVNCMKEFEYLRYLERKFNKQLSIITVFDNISSDDHKLFVEQYNYPWHVTRNMEKGFLYKDYNVRAIPLFFLIAPDGTLLLSPAPAPSEGFEQNLVSYMRRRGDI